MMNFQINCNHYLSEMTKFKELLCTEKKLDQLEDDMDVDFDDSDSKND